MTDLFTEKDFVDDGGYHRRADWIRDTVNARMKALMFERDEAYALLKLIAMHPLTDTETKGLIMAALKEWEKK